MRLILDANQAAERRWPPVNESDPLPPLHDLPIRPAVTSASLASTPAAPSTTVERLYREQMPKLLRFFTRRGVRDEAQDLANDSFVRLLGSRFVTQEELENPEAYLQQVAKNSLRNRARAAFHRSIVDLDLDPETVADASDPTVLLEARDTLTRMDAALAKLPAKTRAIFMAHRLDGVTYAELARRHGLSVKGVDWHMTKAMAHLHRFAGKR